MLGAALILNAEATVCVWGIVGDIALQFAVIVIKY